MNVFEHSPTRVCLKARVRGATEGSWNQIAYVGEWQGHSAGDFQFSREIFERIIANFQRRNGRRKPLAAQQHLDSTL